MTEWHRLFRLGNSRYGVEYWKRELCGSRSVAVTICGHWLRVEWEWVW